MKRILIYFISFIVIIMSTFMFLELKANANPQNKKQSVTLKINGNLLEIKEPIYNIDGRILAPVRFILEPLGFNVEWNENSRTVKATNTQYIVEITVDSNIAKVNNKDIVLDVTAKIINDRVYVPIRFFAEIIGEVNWNPDEKIVDITVVETEATDPWGIKYSEYPNESVIILDILFDNGNTIIKVAGNSKSASIGIWNDEGWIGLIADDFEIHGVRTFTVNKLLDEYTVIGISSSIDQNCHQEWTIGVDSN